MADHDNVIPIKTEAEFNEKVRNSTGLVVVDCFAEWCGPCRAIAPVVNRLAQEYTAAKFYQINVDELSSVAADLGIRAMPTFILFKNGERLSGADVVGANSAALKNAVETNIV
jgi:thioredoxin 1